MSDFLFLNIYVYYFMNDILTYIYEQSCHNCIYGMGSTTIDDIKDYVQYHIENIKYILIFFFCKELLT